MFFLISPDENFRICQVEAQPFEVAEPLFWFLVEDYNSENIYAYVDGQVRVVGHIADPQGPVI